MTSFPTCHMLGLVFLPVVRWRVQCGSLASALYIPLTIRLRSAPAGALG